MSNSISANETANAINRGLRQARIGTKYTAYYLQPRNYYYRLSTTDDYMAMELLVIDQARLWCEKAVRSLSRDRKVYRGRFKQYCSQLWRPRTYPLPVCNEIEQAMMRNMDEEEQMAFGIMASHLDEVIGGDMDKLAITLFNEVARSGAPSQDALTSVLSAHLFGLIAIRLLEDCEKIQSNSHYWLCIEPSEASARDRAYCISSRDLTRMSLITTHMLNELCKGHRFSIPYTVPMENSINIISNKITSVVTIYNACMEAGIEVSKHSYSDLEAIVARIRREDEERKKPQSIEKKKDIKSAAARLAEKGWNVKV